MCSHKAYILQDLLTNITHVFLPEAQKLVIFADFLQVQILQTVLHSERHVDFAINNATFEIKLTDLLFDFQEEVAHEQDVNLFNVFHLHCVDTVDFSYEALGVFSKVIQV